MQLSEETQPTPLTAAWKIAFGLAALFATIAKLYFAYATRGSDDVLSFVEFLAKIREHGGIGIYYQVGSFGNPFNHTPFIVHFLRALGSLADATGIPFKFWLRFPCVLADLLSVWLVWQILGTSWQRKTSHRVAFLLLILSPVSLWISGYHGNFDPEMICFVILSIFLLEKRQHVALAGVAFGVAMSFKAVPVIFAPAFFLYLPDMRRRAYFFLSAGAYFVAVCSPYLLQEPLTVMRAVFGYSSIYGAWGWTHLLVNWLGVDPRIKGQANHLLPQHAFILACGKYLMLCILLGASIWMNRRRNKPPLFLQCGVIVFLFLFLTPGYGSQYHSWLAPWATLLGPVPLLIYSGVTGLFLTLAYSCWEFFHPYLSGCRHIPFRLLQVVCWCVVFVVLIFYFRALRSSFSSSPGSKQR